MLGAAVLRAGDVHPPETTVMGWSRFVPVNVSTRGCPYFGALTTAVVTTGTGVGAGVSLPPPLPQASKSGNTPTTPPSERAVDGFKRVLSLVFMAAYRAFSSRTPIQT